MRLKGEVLITGGGGFIGANIAHRLTQQGVRPHLFVRSSEKDWRIKSILRQVQLYECDLANGQKMNRLVRQIKPKYIFHCAAHGGYSFQTDPKRILRTNILGTFHLVNACLKYGFRLFINNGSSSEYGFKKLACDEKTLPEPNSYYAVSKVSATLYCQYVARAFRAPLLTFRLYSVYGPYEEPKRFIPTLIRSSFRGKSPRLVSPNTARDFIHVDDVVDLYFKAVIRPAPYGEIFNVGTGKQSSVREVVSTIMHLTGVKFHLNWGSMLRRIWDTDIWACDNQKAKRFFRWKPKYDLKSGLAQTIEWYRKNPDCLKESLTSQ